MAVVGWTIVWLVRPYESVVLLAALSVAVLAWLRCRQRHWRMWVPALITGLTVLAAAACVTAVHNRAVTGSMFKMPYHLMREVQGVPQSFLWQPRVEQPEVDYPGFRTKYLLQLKIRDYARQDILCHLRQNLQTTWQFFADTWYTLPLLLAFVCWRERHVRFGGALVLASIAASLGYPFYFAHYIAALTAVFAFLIARGLMLLSLASARYDVGNSGCGVSVRRRLTGRITGSAGPRDPGASGDSIAAFTDTCQTAPS